MAALYTIAIVAGTFFHNIVRNWDIDRYPFSVISVVTTAHLVLSTILQNDNDTTTFWQSQKLAFCLVSTAVMSLWVNMLAYRAFFHPLRRFPGPFGARLSKFWNLGKVLRSKIRWYQVAGDLKEKYGDYVRTGRFYGRVDPGSEKGNLT